MSVRRFKRSSHQMTPCSEGDWVRYEYYTELEAENAALQAELDKRDNARILAGTPLTDVESAVWNALTDAEVVLVYGEYADWMERVGRTREHFHDVKVNILEVARERQTAKIKQEDKR